MKDNGIGKLLNCFYLFKLLQEFFEGEVNYDGLDTPLGVAL